MTRLIDRLEPGDDVSPRFRRRWQVMCETVEDVVADLQTQITNITAALAAATAAAREAARISSYTAPTLVLTAADVGTTVTITIAAHTRIYPVQGSIDVPDLAITAGTITGLGFSTTYHVYYDDTTLIATAPTFLATSGVQSAQVGAAAGRHYLGKVLTPADGAAATAGTAGAYAPGASGGDYIP